MTQADKLLIGCQHGFSSDGSVVLPLSDSTTARSNREKAKRHLADAVEHIIGSDVKLTKTDDVTIEAHKNWLRAEQRKRLAEWLGESR